MLPDNEFDGAKLGYGKCINISKVCLKKYEIEENVDGRYTQNNPKLSQPTPNL